MLSRLRALPALLIGLVSAAVLSGCDGTLIGRVNNAGSYGICSLIWVILAIMALLDLWKSNRSDKVLWTVVIVVFPVLGSILYYIIGRK